VIGDDQLVLLGQRVGDADLQAARIPFFAVGARAEAAEREGFQAFSG